MSENVYERQEMVVPREWYEAKGLVVGVGAIGKPVAMLLAQMGMGTVGVVDPDDVESVNVATQGYPRMQVGQAKIQATMEEAEMFRWPLEGQADSLWGIKGKFAQGHLVRYGRPQVVFLCVDSMAARREIGGILRRAWGPREKGEAMVDARLAAEYGRLVTVQGGDAVDEGELWDAYTMTTCSDEEAWKGPAERCTVRMTAYMAHVMAGLAVRQAVHVLRGETVPADMMVNMRDWEVTQLEFRGGGEEGGGSGVG